MRPRTANKCTRFLDKQIARSWYEGARVLIGRAVTSLPQSRHGTNRLLAHCDPSGHPAGAKGISYELYKFEGRLCLANVR